MPSASMKGLTSSRRWRAETWPLMTQNREPPSSSSTKRFGTMRVVWRCSPGWPERRCSLKRAAIQPSLGASVYTIDSKAIAALPGGDNLQLNQVVLQSPGVAQDSFGQLHVRGEHNGLQFRLNGVILPEGLSVFSQDFQVLCRPRINHLEPLVQIGDEHASALAGKRCRDALAVTGGRDLTDDLRFDRFKQRLAVSDQQTGGQRVVFCL